MTTLRIVVLGCVLAAVAITLKVRIDTPQGPQPPARNPTLALRVPCSMNRVRGESAGHNDRRHKHCGAQIRKFFGNGGDRFLTDF